MQESKDLSLYIHIPFCKSRCAYCGFLTFAGMRMCEKSVCYAESLCAEIVARGREFSGRKIETIYFGGGTPSFIDANLIKKIIERIKAYFTVKRGAEVSIECNPESVTEEKIEIYKSAGINRFSLGIQSFSEKILRRVERPCGKKAVFRALEILKKAKIKNFGADFIIGLPGQSFALFKREVETIIKFRPEHLSYYFLSPDTSKIKEFIKGCPSEDEQIRMYDWLCKRLKISGFEHYEISNFARKGFECAHNKRYWNQKDYLGLGLGAHSIVGGEIWENQKNLSAYLKDPLPTVNHMKIDSDLKRMEYIMLRLRTKEGIDLAAYSKFGDVYELLSSAAKYIKTGHLARRRGELIATEKGFLISDRILQALI